MTRQESFKKRIRARMARTGERYNAARRVLLEQSASRDHGTSPDTAPSGSRRWISEPDNSEQAIRDNTGRGWDEWCDLIDAWPGHDDGHGAVAGWLVEQHDVEGWWAQAVTVGWERITGRRLPHQRSDGTFSASKSRTITIDREALRAMLLDDEDRALLFGGETPELRSRPTSRNVRLGMPTGIAEISLEPRGDDRTVVAVQHEKLSTPDDVGRWKDFWSGWLDDLDEG